MDFTKLEKQANLAVSEIDFVIEKHGVSDQIESINQQILFIRENAKNNKDPSEELGDKQKLTYSIIASREFTCPSELQLKESLYKVSRLLDQL